MINNLPKKKYPGFTLIEMMVAVTVLGIITAVGVARYRQFNEKQKVITSGKEVATILRDTQKKAKAGDKPDTCTGTLQGYEARTLQSTSIVDVWAICSNGNIQVKSENLTTDTIFESGEVILFEVVTGGVRSQGTGVISLVDVNGRYEYQIEITSSGAINDLGMVEE